MASHGINADLIARDEYVERQSRLRGALVERDLDAAIVFGRDERNGNGRGRVHYITGLLSIAGSYAAVIFRDTEPVLYQQAFVGSEWAASHVAVDDVRSEPDLIPPLAELLTERGCTRVGLIGHEVAADVKDYLALLSLLPDDSTTDLTEAFDDLRYSKSPNEVAAAEQTAHIVRTAFDAVRAAAAPGLTERELASVAWESLHRSGVRSGLVHMSRSNGIAFGRPANDSTIQADDLFSVSIEVRGPSEYAIEAGIALSFIQPPQMLLDRLAIENEVMDAVLNVMVPGATTDDMYRAMVDGYGRHGLTLSGPKGAGPVQFAAHGIGLDHFERPSVPGTRVELVENAIIGVHPSASGGPQLPFGVGAGDTTVVTATGGRRLVYPKSVWTVL